LEVKDLVKKVILLNQVIFLKIFNFIIAIFSNVSRDDKIYKEEIFGPVCSIIKFKNVKEVIEMCNEHEYGLAAAVITKDISNMFAISNSVQSGTVWVNTYHVVLYNAPFGGKF
jgi:aldehyde dehydrogenase (NAD+)